jgi:hypothetical protein
VERKKEGKKRRKRGNEECIRMGAGKEQSVSFRAQTKPLRVLARKAYLGRIACREPVVMWDLLESDMRSEELFVAQAP